MNWGGEHCTFLEALQKDTATHFPKSSEFEMPQKDIHEAHKHISLTNQQIIGTATNLDVTTPSSIKAQHKQLPTINNTTLSQILLCSEDVSSSRDALFGSVAAIADSLLLAESMSVDLSYLLENVLCSSLNQVIIITVTK
jgi:hypothetical protein